MGVASPVNATVIPQHLINCISIKKQLLAAVASTPTTSVKSSTTYSVKPLSSLVAPISSMGSSRPSLPVANKVFRNCSALVLLLLSLLSLLLLLLLLLLSLLSVFDTLLNVCKLCSKLLVVVMFFSSVSCLRLSLELLVDLESSQC